MKLQTLFLTGDTGKTGNLLALLSSRETEWPVSHAPANTFMKPSTAKLKWKECNLFHLLGGMHLYTALPIKPGLEPFGSMNLMLS